MTRLRITAAKLCDAVPCVGQWLRQRRASRSSDGDGRRAPRRDGARSWVVAVAAFASMLFSIGLSFGTVGVMTVVIGEHFKGASRSELSWVGGLRMLFTFCTGIAASALHGRIGSRRLQIIGATIVCVATGLSSLSTELWHMYVTFGALAGVGLSMVFTSASVAVDGLFDRYLHVALPLSQFGGSVGMSVFPALARAVVSALGFRGSIYVLCGLSFAPALWALLYVEAARPQSGGGEKSAASGNDADVAKTEVVCFAAVTAATAAASPATSDARYADGEGKQQAATVWQTSLPLSTQAAQCLALALQSTLIGGSAESDSNAEELQVTEDAAATRHCVGVAATGTDPSATAIDALDDQIRARCETGTTSERQSHIHLIVSESPVSTAEPASAACHISTKRLSTSFPLPEHDFRQVAAGSGTATAISAACVAVADLEVSEQRVEKQTSLAESSLPLPAPPPSHVDPSEVAQWRRMLHLLAVGDTWLGLLHFFCRQYASSAIVVLLPTLASSASRLPAEAGTLSVTVLFVTTVPGLVTMIALGARAFNRMLLAAVACTMLGATTMACAPALTAVGSFYPLCAFAGYWLGMILGLFMSVVKQLCGTRARLADVFGLTAFASGLGGLAGPAVSGILLTISEPEMTLYATGGVAILAGVALIAPAVRRPTRPLVVSDAEQAAEAQEEAAAAAAAKAPAAAPVAAVLTADVADPS